MAWSTRATSFGGHLAARQSSCGSECRGWTGKSLPEAKIEKPKQNVQSRRGIGVNRCQSQRVCLPLLPVPVSSSQHLPPFQTYCHPYLGLMVHHPVPFYHSASLVLLPRLAHPPGALLRLQLCLTVPVVLHIHRVISSTLECLPIFHPTHPLLYPRLVQILSHHPIPLTSTLHSDFDTPISIPPYNISMLQRG